MVDAWSLQSIHIAEEAANAIHLGRLSKDDDGLIDASVSSGNVSRVCMVFAKMGTRCGSSAKERVLQSASSGAVPHVMVPSLSKTIFRPSTSSVPSPRSAMLYDTNDLLCNSLMAQTCRVERSGQIKKVLDGIWKLKETRTLRWPRCQKLTK